MRGLRSHRPAPEGDGGDSGRSAAVRRGRPADARAARALAAGGSTAAGLAGLTTLGVLVAGCSTGGTGMRDEGPAVPAPVERTMPTPSTTPSPARASVDPVTLLRADPQVSGRIKSVLKECGAGSYPVNTSYGDLTGSSQPDLVVNVTTCKDSIGVATYVYRLTDDGTASPTPAPTVSTTAGSASGDGASATGAASRTVGGSASATAGRAASDAGKTLGTADKMASDGAKAAGPDGPSPGVIPDNGASEKPDPFERVPGGDGSLLTREGGTPRQTRPLPGKYQNVFAAEKPSVYGTIDRGELVVTQQLYTKGDPESYPSAEDVVTYDWSKSKFTERYRVRNTYGKPDGGDDLSAPAPTVTAPN